MEQGTGNEDEAILDHLEYDEGSGEFRVAIDWREDTSLSTTIVLAVTEISGLDEADLEPLIERIDPDALDDIFAPYTAEATRDDGMVRFLFADHVVTVYARGEIGVDPPQSGSF